MRRIVVQGLVFSAGCAALSWEVLWQLQATLALGASARGTAIVLATVMAGMSGGALLTARFLLKNPAKPLRAYGFLELVIGLSGLLMLPGFQLLEKFDRTMYQVWPDAAALAHGAGIALVIGIPCLAMGATIPVLGLVAQSFGLSISRFYAVNTAGAAIGCLALAFFVMPRLGVYNSTLALVGINLGVAFCSMVLATGTDDSPEPESPTRPLYKEDTGAALFLVTLTGFVTFSLEVSWFRSLRAAFQATSESFALMLAAVLLVLALGARMAGWPRFTKFRIGHALFLAGCLIILATPAIERFDLWTSMGKTPYWVMMSKWFGLSLLVMGPPVALTGLVLPRLLDSQTASKGWARLYALNTAGAIAGSLAAAWVFLPLMGSIKTSILVGGVTLLSGAYLLNPVGQIAGVLATVALSAFALSLQSGIGHSGTDAAELRRSEQPLFQGILRALRQTLERGRHRGSVAAVPSCSHLPQRLHCANTPGRLPKLSALAGSACPHRNRRRSQGRTPHRIDLSRI